MTVSIATAGAASPAAARVRAGQKLAHLQALRGVAATLVVLYHAMEALAQRQLVPQAAADRLAGSAYFGVAVFFIISGFIITKTSAGSFGTADGMAGFLAKRLIRIFPVYWIATALFFALSPHRAEFGAADVAWSLLLVPHAIGTAGDMHPLVGQAWTLQYEMLFYAIFAAGMCLRRTAGLIAIVAVLGGLVLLGDAVKPLSEVSEPLTVAAYWTRPIVLLFAAGIGLGVLERLLAGRLALRRPFLLMLAICLGWFAYSAATPLPPAELLRFPHVALVWLVCAVLVFVSVFGRGGEGALETLAHRFGDASYSVYLFHNFVLSLLLRLKLQEASPALFVCAALIGANVLGVLVYAHVEQPILKTLRRTLLRAPPS